MTTAKPNDWTAEALLSSFSSQAGPVFHNLVEAIREIVGDEHLDRIILFGSFVDGGGWNPEASDVNIAVLLTFPDFAPDSDVMTLFNEATDQQRYTASIEQSLEKLRDRADLTSFASRLAFFVADAKQVERLRNFAPCMPSKLLNGDELYANPERRIYPSLPAEEARNLVIQRKMTYAAQLIDSARQEIFDRPVHRKSDEFYGNHESNAAICSDAHAAACSCLCAMLYRHNIDPSIDKIEWKTEELLKRLSKVVPEVIDSFVLTGVYLSLPNHYDASFPQEPAINSQARLALSAAIRIFHFAYRHMCREFGLTPLEGKIDLQGGEALMATRLIRSEP